jgi:hypothetical protein
MPAKLDPNKPRRLIRCRFQHCRHRWLSQVQPRYCPKCRSKHYATGVPGKPGRPPKRRPEVEQEPSPQIAASAPGIAA